MNLRCRVCCKTHSIKDERHPLKGVSGWSYMKGGVLVCSNECAEEWEQLPDAKVIRVTPKTVT